MWRLLLIMIINFWSFGKRGGISNFISFLGATIFIILILGAFVFGARVVKSFDNAESGVVVYGPKDVGIDNIVSYSKRYSSLVRAKFLVAGGQSVNVGLKEVGYEK